MDERLVSLPLNKEMLRKTPEEVVVLLLGLLPRVEELKTIRTSCFLS